jgi:predicted dehydrogenase
VFAGDILLDPKTRGVTDVRHEIVAVGSRSEEKARAFADSFGLTACKAYGGYDGVFADEVRTTRR